MSLDFISSETQLLEQDTCGIVVRAGNLEIPKSDPG